ncbi:MAG: RHS repeat-associated core domain-containing protein [Chloroflexi bacterium]|nr:RHS repeat-associated core domain-containing protein [Chloroflexota bacterium]
MTGTSLTTDTSGTVVGSIKYKPYGETRSSSGVLPAQKFTGQRLDDVGLYYYGARYYDPALGRFISADSLVPRVSNPQNFNRYTYVLNNPLRYVDPTGSEETDPGQVIGFFGPGGKTGEAVVWENGDYAYYNSAGGWSYTSFDITAKFTVTGTAELAHEVPAGTWAPLAAVLSWVQNVVHGISGGSVGQITASGTVRLTGSVRNQEVPQRGLFEIGGVTMRGVSYAAVYAETVLEIAGVAMSRLRSTMQLVTKTGKNYPVRFGSDPRHAIMTGDYYDRNLREFRADYAYSPIVGISYQLNLLVEGLWKPVVDLFIDFTKGSGGKPYSVTQH